jgi:hypothetical protein
MTDSTQSRRRVIQSLGVGLVAGLAGCSQFMSDQPATGESTPTDATGATTAEPSDTTATATPEPSDTTGTATPEPSEEREPDTYASVDTSVELVATFPNQTEDGVEQRRETILTGEDFAGVRPPRQGSGDRPPYVTVTLTETGAETYTEAMQKYGFTSGEGLEACNSRSQSEDPGYCVQTVVDGEIVYSGGMDTGLAEIVESGAFKQNPTFRLLTTNFSEAQELASNLRD